MTERRHELTDADIRDLLRQADASCHDVDAVLAALPSRQPKDPDAGLGALPWRPVRGYGLGVIDSDGCGVVMVHDAARDPEAVLRACLGLPKAIKLARKVMAEATEVDGDAAALLKFFLPDASEVIAIADGKEERS